MRRAATLYLSAGKPAIVASIYSHPNDGSYEQEDPLVVAAARDQLALATAIRAAIERFSLKDRNLRDLKSTEWPSYRASKCRSVNEFERTFLQIGIIAVNDSELFYEATAQPRGEDDITLQVLLNRYGSDEEMGRKILKLFDTCDNWHRG